jgi:hypothetical protein
LGGDPARDWFWEARVGGGLGYILGNDLSIDGRYSTLFPETGTEGEYGVTAVAPDGKKLDLEAYIEANSLPVQLLDIEPANEAKAPAMISALAAGTVEIVVYEERAIAGLPIVIDRPAGTVQRGIGPDGPWLREYLVDYGYIDGTIAHDGDGIDVYLGPSEGAPNAYIVEQVHRDGSFDEHKIMLDFLSYELAIGTYLLHVPAWCFSSARTMPTSELPDFIAAGCPPLAIATE